MKELSVPIVAGGKKPIYEQIYDYIKKEIRDKKLRAETKLPSTRALSAHLNVSRSTVQLAYDQLLSEGYIESRPCKGYYVLKLDGLYDLAAVERRVIKHIEKEDEKYEIDFSPSGIELDSFPYNSWRKVSKAVMSGDTGLFNMGEPQGDFELRETISGYLHESRGVNCSPGNIIVGAGDEYLLMLLDQLLTNAHNKVLSYAMENPAYRKAYFVLNGIGREVHPIMLDGYGMDCRLLRESDVNVAYVTPSHQYPMGIVMSIGRRMEMLSWAKEKDDRYIIEDDYDSEFRYRGKPIPALQGLDKDGKVVYIGTFSKSIAPGLRMSYMVLPDRLMESYAKVGMRYSNTVSRIDQNIVNRFIKDGYYERHLNKMRGIYKSKHDVLLGELKKFGDEYEVSGESAGLHILLSTDTITEGELVKKAAAKGVRVYPLSAHFLETGNERDNALNAAETMRKLTGKESTIILGYARLCEDEIVRGTKLLWEAFS